MVARHVGKIIHLLDHKFDEKNEHMIDDKHKKLQTVHNWIGKKIKYLQKLCKLSTNCLERENRQFDTHGTNDIKLLHCAPEEKLSKCRV